MSFQSTGGKRFLTVPNVVKPSYTSILVCAGRRHTASKLQYITRFAEALRSLKIWRGRGMAALASMHHNYVSDALC